jgi:predicted HTH domain antitoxin
MELIVPDHIAETLDLSPEIWRLDLALGLYIDNRVSAGRAAELAGISKPAFLDELGKRRIPVQYDVEDLEADVRTLEALRPKS